jgi:WD40 repeat protein
VAVLLAPEAARKPPLFLTAGREVAMPTTDGRLLRWTIPDTVPPSEVRLDELPSPALDLSPDGERIGASCQNGRVYALRWRDGTTVQAWQTDAHSMTGVVWLSEHRLLASVDEGRYVALDEGSAEPVSTLRGTGDAYRIAHAGGRIFAGGNGHDVSAWDDVTSSAPRWTVPFPGSIGVLEVLPAGDLLVNAFNDEVTWLDAATGTVEGRMRLRGDGWGAAGLSPDRRSAAISVRFAQGIALQRIALPLPADLGPDAVAEVLWSTALPTVASVAWSPDGTTLAAATLSGQILLFDAATGTLLARLRGHRPSAFDLVFLDGGTALATTGSDGYIRIWDLADLRTPAEAP